MATEEVIVLHNFKALEKFFINWPINAKHNIGDFWDTVTHYMHRQTVKRFRQEKDPDGFPWAKHSQLTINARMK